MHTKNETQFAYSADFALRFASNFRLGENLNYTNTHTHTYAEKDILLEISYAIHI